MPARDDCARKPLVRAITGSPDDSAARERARIMASRVQRARHISAGPYFACDGEIRLAGFRDLSPSLPPRAVTVAGAEEAQ